MMDTFRRSLRALFGVSIFQGSPSPALDDFENIRMHLSQYPGGSVDLKLNDTSGIGLICLNNPDKKNAITGSMMIELERIIDKLETWEIGKGILVFGAENNFCSGGDLNFAQETGTAEGGYRMATFMQDVLLRLQQLPMVSVAFIEGLALGGGSEMAISCDFRVFASNDSGMGFVHSRMGIIPAWGGITAAVQKLGYCTTLDLVTTARLVQGEEAQKIGLCDAVVGDISGAMAWLGQRTRADASVIRAAKCVAYNSLQASINEDVLKFEKMVFSPLWGGPANKLALSQKLKHNRSN